MKAKVKNRKSLKTKKGESSIPRTQMNVKLANTDLEDKKSGKQSAASAISKRKSPEIKTRMEVPD